MITYYEAFEGRFGPVNYTKLEIDDTVFAMALALARDVEKNVDVIDDIEELIEESTKGKMIPMLFVEALTNFGYTPRAKEITRAIENVGLWVDTCEEGTIGFAVTSLREKCRRAIVDIEAGFATARVRWY